MWARYLAWSARRPTASTFATAAFLGLAGDTLMQAIERLRESRPTSWDVERAGRFTSFRIFLAAPYLGWVRLLERLNMLSSRRAVVLKVALDCFVWTPAVQSIFFTWMAYAEGQSLRASFERAIHSMPTSLPASWVVWLPAQAINYALVPISMRVNFVSLVNVLWLAAMSGFNARGSRQDGAQDGARSPPAAATAASSADGAGASAAVALGTDAVRAVRSATVWLGGVRPGWGEGEVAQLFAPAEVQRVTLRRKGWRDEQTGERVGYALVQLATEADAEHTLARLQGTLDVRRHKWASADDDACADDGAAEPDDPIARLLTSAVASHPPEHAQCEGSDGLALGGMPPLEEQLAPLTISQARARLRAFGCEETAALERRAQRRGGRVEKKACLLALLCRLHRERPRAFPRRVLRAAGAPLATTLLESLLHELRTTLWPRKKRNVDAQQYLVLGVAAAGVAPKLLPRHEPLWRAACAALHSLAPGFAPTSIAVTHGFRGSPHCDVGDTTPQYLLSVGEFAEGGELCVEASPCELVLVDTRNRLARVDGRFPHWVRDYSGERFSVVFYRLEGPVEPAVRALHPLCP